ncbi:MAG: hypothetical protein IJH09_12960, partial [Clostridia bacterium]|nr:hypothetical protein [Clostridia bacterium]
MAKGKILRSAQDDTFRFVVILSEAKDLYIPFPISIEWGKPSYHHAKPTGFHDVPDQGSGIAYTKFHLRYAQMRSGFFVLAKLSGERRCSASLTEAKQSQGGKDARSC